MGDILKKTLLIADDISMNRAILAEMFKDTYTIAQADNGLDALAQLKNDSSIVIVLLDIIMPKADSLVNNKVKVMMGDFPMVIQTITKTDTAKKSYSGDGYVIWHPLGVDVRLKVRFDSIQINKDYQVINGSAVSSATDSSTYIPAFMNDLDLEEWTTDDITYCMSQFGDMEKIKSYYNKFQQYGEKYGKKYGGLLGPLNGESLATEVLTFPLSVTDKEVTGSENIIFAINNMFFSPVTALMNFWAIFAAQDDDYYVPFLANNVCMDQRGFLGKADQHIDMFMGRSYEKKLNDGYVMRFKASSNFANPTDGTVISIDTGKLNYIIAQIEFDLDNNDFLGIEKDGTPRKGKIVKASLTTKFRSWSDWVAKISMDPFAVAGCDRFTFVPTGKGIFFDHSTKETPKEVNLTYEYLYGTPAPANMKDEDKKVDTVHNIVNGVVENTIADVLKLKTTQIESRIENNLIYTTLTDRGIKMYEIEEENTNYGQLKSASISLFYLNRAAKYNFSAKMGIQPVNYGNVFLFRNGFRILPFGEFNDDSWGINQRQQQGYNRRIGTRDLFGRVDVDTNDVNLIKEVSSRDGGLIKTVASQQLMGYFSETHKRIERYVVGVLWGEGFVRKDYFVNQSSALKARELLQEMDKDQESAKHLYNNIGSKVDFMQLIRTLVNDSNITVKYYNEELADIVSNPSETEVIQAQMFEDVRKMAEKTYDDSLLKKIADFEHYIDEMRRQKEEAERKAKEEERKAEKARKETQEEKEKREKVERERDAQIQKNKYLSATRNTSKDVLDLVHTVLISSTNSVSLIKTAKLQLADKNLVGLRESLDSFDYDINRIHLLSKMITKADLTLLSESQLIDIENYIKEYFSNYKPKCKVQYHSDITEVLEKKIAVLDLSIVLDNLVSNSEKADATEFRIDFARDGRTYIVDFTDNGVGVDLDLFTADSIFEEGVTNRRGGSGIGLSTIKERMKNELNGEIQFVGNGLHFKTGATFRLIFE